MHLVVRTPRPLHRDTPVSIRLDRDGPEDPLGVEQNFVPGRDLQQRLPSIRPKNEQRNVAGARLHDLQNLDDAKIRSDDLLAGLD